MKKAFQRQSVVTVLCCILSFLLFQESARAYTLYGYRDEYGIVHLNEEKVDQDFVLLVEASSKPKLSFKQIAKIIDEKGAVKPLLNKKWREENVLKDVRRKNAGLYGKGPYRYPALINDKKILSCIDRVGETYKIDPKLLYSVIEQESGFHAQAVSPKGAMGMMQLMPETQRFWGLKRPFNPEENIKAGARHLRWLLNKFSSVKLALAAYNAGHEAVLKYRGIPPFPETRTYVARILQRYAMLKTN